MTSPASPAPLPPSSKPPAPLPPSSKPPAREASSSSSREPAQPVGSMSASSIRRLGGIALERGSLTAAGVASAVLLQGRIADRTAIWLRVGEVLLLRGDLSVDFVKELRGSALFPVEGTTLPEAELYGEIALRKHLISPAQFLECLEIQARDRREGRAHRLIGSLLVDKGYLKPKQLQDCEQEFRHDARLHRDEARRASHAAAVEEKEKPVLTPLDAAYIRAARGGELPTDEVLSGVGKAKTLAKVLGRAVGVWEILVCRGTVTLDQHRKLIDRSCNVKTATHGSWMLGGIIAELGYAKPPDVAAALEQRATEARRTGAKPRRLGEILLERKLITQAELDEALRVQAFRRNGRPGTPEGPRRVNKRAVAVLVLLLAALAGGLSFGPIRLRLAARAVADPSAGIERRVAALRTLEADGREWALAAIADVAADPHAPPDLRSPALRAVARARLDAAGPALRAALDAPHSRLRSSAAWALGDRRDAGAEAALRVRATRDPEPEVRLAAARALALIGAIEGREALVAALAPASPERRKLGLDVERPDAEVASEVVRALEELSGFRLGMRAERWAEWLALQPTADLLCGRQRGPDIAARFGVLFQSPRIGVRFGAARALAHLGDGRGAPLLLQALDRGQTQLRSLLLDERGLDVERIEPEIAGLLALLRESRNAGTGAGAEPPPAPVPAPGTGTGTDAGAESGAAGSGTKP